MEELEERVQTLEDWMADTRRVYDPSFLMLDGHVAAHCGDDRAIKRLEKDVEAMMVMQGKIKRALLTLFSYGEIHPLIEELNKE